ncbi:MAG: general secretion pathway protein GspB [Pseudomonadota bacterium]
MSYILESLKKSEKERRSINNPAAAVIDSPAFLENDREELISNQWIIILLLALLLLGLSMYHWLFKGQTDDALPSPPSSQAVLSQASSTVNKKQTPAKPVASLQAREQAVLLYEQALAAKKQPDVNSLYQKLSDNKSAPSTDTRSTADIQNQVNQDDAQALSASATPESANPAGLETKADERPVKKSDEAGIPIIYELDSLTKRNIPALEYGAHIYATDNRSGFIILNGARRRVGDQLDNGIFIEKIAEESVVLSYNGVLFSLPAMKSWVGK